MALLLSDHTGHLVERWAGSSKTSDLMDGVGAAPGYVCREELIGTNSIGLAANQGNGGTARSTARGGAEEQPSLSTG